MRDRYPVGSADCLALHWRAGQIDSQAPFVNVAMAFFDSYGVKPERMESARGIVAANEQVFEKAKKRSSMGLFAGGKISAETIQSLAWDLCVQDDLDTGDFFLGKSVEVPGDFQSGARVFLIALIEAGLPIVSGYFYSRELRFGPYMFQHGNISVADDRPNDEDQVAQWSEARRLGCHLERLRDVYDCQLLGPRQRDLQIGGQSLEAWIRLSSRHGRIEDLPKGYALWTIDTAFRCDIQMALARAGVLVVQP